mgnify:CR=1 FL=1
MGTRNLTMVIDQNGEKKVAQYGQWDGYPSGVGSSILIFLKNEELFGKLKDNLSKVRFLDDDKDKEFIESYNKNSPKWSDEPDNRTDDQKKWFANYCHRDLAEEVLTNIAKSTDEEIILINREETAKSGGMVEYSYLINLKENTFGVYNYIDQDPIKVYSLNALPSEEAFLLELEGCE